MSFYYQSGEGMNLLARSAAVNVPIAVNGVIDANFPLANLPDGRPSSYMRYSTPADGEYITFDLNLLAYGDGEQIPVSYVWTATAGTIESSNSQTYGSGGSRALRVYNATAPSAYRDVRMRAGEAFRVYYAARGATGTSTIRVTNLATGLDLTTGPAWGSGVLVSQATAAWADGYVTYVMPSAEAGGALWQTLRVTCAVSGAAGDGYFEVKIVPGWDTIALLGHTNSPANPIRFSYAALTGNDPRDAYGGGANVSDWVKAVPAAAEVFAGDEYNEGALWNKAATMRYERWVRFTLTQGVPLTSALGELILCQAETLTSDLYTLTSISEEATMPGQVRLESGAGDVWAYNRTRYTRKRATLTFRSYSPPLTGNDPLLRTVQRIFLDRTAGGMYPALVIPYEHDPRTLYYGSAAASLAHTHESGRKTYSVELVDWPIPSLSSGLTQA